MDKKIIRIISIIIAVVAASLIVVAIVMSLQKDEKTNKSDGYKQCEEKDLSDENKMTNYKHNKQNYYLDEKNNRINNSIEISKSHNSTGENGKEDKFTITDMKIVSKNCDENMAEMNASLTNNSEEEFTDLMLVFDIFDKNGNNTHTFGLTVEKIGKGETVPIEIKTLGRIIDAYNYQFTYADASERVG